MGSLVLVGLGGVVGAILRFVIGAQTQEFFKSVTFPTGTLAVNVSGCLVIGLLSYLADFRGALTPNARILLMSGLVGAFTTFSSYSLETLNLFSSGQTSLAVANILANNIFGLAAVWLGRTLPWLIWR